MLKALEKEAGASAGESAVLAGQAPILEIDIDKYPADVKDSISAYGDAVIITFSRVGGEGTDNQMFDNNESNNSKGYEWDAYNGNYLALSEEERSVLMGLKAAKDAGIEWLVVENDDPVPNGLEDVKRSIAYLKTLVG